MQGVRRRSVFRRRRQNLTDYRRRLKLLRGRVPRAVVRVSNTRTTCQLTNYKVDGDEVVVNITGSDLISKFGWPENNSQKSVPASYLVGYAAGKAAMAKGMTEAVLDIGLAPSTSGNRVFATLNGLVDAGMEIPHSDEILPSDERINGAHIDEGIEAQVESTKAKIEEAF